MLRIEQVEKDGAVRLRLEGRLVGPWVEELERCCRKVLARPEVRNLIIDLVTVSYIDAEGKEALAKLHRAGARLDAAGTLSRYVVDSIQDKQTSCKLPEAV